MRNVRARGLAGAIDVMTRGFAKLRQRERFTASVKESFRAIEVTAPSDDEDHPRMHLVVRPGYFDPRGNLDIGQPELAR